MQTGSNSRAQGCDALLTAGKGKPWPVFDAAGGWSMGLNLIQGVTSRWERGDVGELQGVRMAMGLEEIQVGDAAAGA